MADAKPAKRPDLPKGWQWVDFATKPQSGKREGEHYLAANTKQGKFEVDGPIWVAVPVTQAAQKDATASATATFDGQDGEVELTGPAALVAMKYKDGYESRRSDLAKEAGKGKTITTEYAQGRFDAYRPYSGRNGGPKVATEEVDSITDVDELKALLRARGVVG